MFNMSMESPYGVDISVDTIDATLDLNHFLPPAINKSTVELLRLPSWTSTEMYDLDGADSFVIDEDGDMDVAVVKSVAPGGQVEAGGVEVGAAVKAVGDEPYTYDTSLEGLIQKVGESSRSRSDRWVRFRERVSFFKGRDVRQIWRSGRPWARAPRRCVRRDIYPTCIARAERRSRRHIYHRCTRSCLCPSSVSIERVELVLDTSSDGRRVTSPNTTGSLPFRVRRPNTS